MIVTRRFSQKQKGWRVGIQDIFVYAVLLCAIGFFMVLPLRNSSIRHIFVLIGSIVFYIGSIGRLLSARIYRNRFFAIAALGVLLLFDAVTSFGSFSVDIIYACLNFFSLFILISIKPAYPCSSASFKAIYRGCVIIALLLFITSISPAAYIFEDGRRTGALVLGMTNPNLTAMMILCIFNVLIINFRYTAKKAVKFSLVVILAGLLYLLWLTRARGSILAAAVVVLYAAFFKNISIPRFVIYTAVIVPIVFVPAYLGLYSSGAWHANLFLGKVLFSGREHVYMAYLSGMETIPRMLFGNLGAIQFGNAHNAALSIYCSIGIVGAMIVYISFLKRLLEMNDAAHDETSRTVVICMLSIFILSCVEALMFTGVFPSIVFMYIFMILVEREPLEAT